MITVKTDSRLVLSKIGLVADDLAKVNERLDAAATVVYAATRERFDAEGDGEWPALMEATVTRKASLGYPDPGRTLYATGDLFESATSPNGPYSQLLQATDAIHLIVNWMSDDGTWQLGSVLDLGNESGTLPPRPIWPDPSDRQLQEDVANMLTATMIIKPELE